MKKKSDMFIIYVHTSLIMFFKHKASLISQGCYQAFEIDFIDTYKPMLQGWPITVRLMLALSVLLNLKRSNVVLTKIKAFLNEEMRAKVDI